MKRLLFFLVTMLTGVASLFAEEKVVTIDVADALWVTTRGAQSGKKDGVTIAVTDGIMGTEAYRAYASSTFTVSVDNGNITRIEITSTASGTSNYGVGNFSSKVGKYSYSGKNGTWVGNSSIVELSASKQVRMTSIKVTYEVDSSTPTPEVTALALSETTPVQTEYYVGDAFSTEGLVATATFDDASTQDVTDAASWTCEPAVIAEDTKTVTVTASYKNQTVSKTYNVTVKSIANTAETAYTVEEAVALIDAGKGLNAEVYVKGIVSKVAKFNDSYGQIDYYISTDGTEEAQQLECYNGLNIGGNKFTSIDDVEVGAQVVVKGQLTQFGSTYELGRGNELVSYVMETKTVTSLTISGTATKVSYMVGEKPSADGLTVEAIFDDATTQDVTNKVVWTFIPETIVEGTTQVIATATYGDKSTTITYDIAIKTQTINDSYILDLTTNTSTSESTKQVVWNTGVGTLVLDKAQSGTNANNYLGGTAGHTRTYKDQIMTINPTISIAKVVFTCPSSTYANYFNGYTLTNADKYISGSNVELIPEEPLSPMTITFNQACRFTQMVIYTTISATISDAGYATLCLPYAGIMPEGVTAYAAKDNGTNITLIEREGGIIAAEEGVLLKGAAGTYSFAAKPGAVAKADVNNLVGITEDTPLKSEDGVYLLSRNKTTNKTAFRLLDANYTLSAHKAYLKPEVVSYSRLMIDIDDEVETGIDTVSGQENGTKINVIYNLAGQRMSRATKGINIVNGKLILK